MALPGELVERARPHPGRQGLRRAAILRFGSGKQGLRWTWFHTESLDCAEGSPAGWNAGLYRLASAEGVAPVGREIGRPRAAKPTSPVLVSVLIIRARMTRKKTTF